MNVNSFSLLAFSINYHEFKNAGKCAVNRELLNVSQAQLHQKLNSYPQLKLNFWQSSRLKIKIFLLNFNPKEPLMLYKRDPEMYYGCSALFIPLSRIFHYICYMQSKKASQGGIKTVDINDFIFLATIGQGSSSQVKLAKKKNVKKFSCIKIMKKQQIIKSQQVQHALNQYRIVRSISHPFIVNFEGAAQNSRHLYLVLQFVPGGELFTHLREQGKFDPRKAAFYASQIVLCFEYIHSLNIIYRDLKPENLLIGADGYLKLADFGFSKVVETRTYTLCGTPQYIAPEVLQKKGHGKAADWWALGILIYEMIAGIDPFADEDPLSIYHNILKGKVQFPKQFDNDARSLVKHLLVADLSKRYGNLKDGVADIKNHRYLNSIDWGRLIAKKLPAPFKPVIRSPSDTSHFFVYEENDQGCGEIISREDPFLKWDE